ncbi:hypothetical protein CVIRNUC_010256 [Coccomyxa viridis]|uniref:Exocyst complex component Sec6 n=1 Tax=Coccomyxa viridis TaxID=1274662 RepID=A0AAV1ILV1_9CHLO|nr:hypothetical protein CVIRNUC_010256 [Coccomyxa viridis]
MESSIPEQAVDARRAAVDEVERLLQHPEDLKRLPNMLEEYTQKHHANKVQLSATVASQVDAARSGMELLEGAQKTLAKMQQCYDDIDKLCTECASLIDNHDKIKDLSAVHYNLGKTLQDVENIVALPQQAAEAEDMLKDDTQLSEAYESLAILEATSTMAQRALESNSKLKGNDSRNISAYFNKVRMTMGKVEERLWSIIRSFATLGRDQPAMLVNAVRIIELQELVDKSLEASTGGTMGVMQPKRYRKRCEQQIGMSIQDNFAPLLRNCAQLAAAEENTDKRTGEILDSAHDFVVQLADIFDYVTPCFPEKYGIFRVIFREYHQHLSFMLDCIGCCAEQLSNSDILKVVGWTSGYQETLKELGLEDSDIVFPEGHDRGMTLLVNKYIMRMRATLHTWFVNILQGDMSGEPKQADDGKLWTPGAVDFFRIVNEQVSVVEEVSSGEMLLQTGEAVMGIMKEFQEAQETHLQKDLSDGLLCAVINNNTRCYNESTEFADHLDDTLAPPYKGRLDVEAQCRGFLELSKEAVSHLVSSIFSDAAFLELFHKLFCSEDWQQGTTTDSILATVGDYLEEFEHLIEAFWFKRLAVCCLEETVAHYVASLLTYTRAITDPSLKRMEADYQQLCDFFEKSCAKERVSKVCQPLDDLRDLAASDSVDTFVLSYTSLLQTAPGITPALVERLVASRQDLNKADIKEVMDQCREVYATRQRSLAEDASPLPKAKAGAGKDWSAFRVALMAAKRKIKPPSGRI